MQSKFVVILIGLSLGLVSLVSVAEEENPLPISFHKIISTFTVSKDGSFREVKEISERIENEDGVSNFGEKKISYIPRLESVRILSAFTILPNGSHINVPLKNIHTAKGDMDSASTSYSDTQYKVIIYPNVVVGSQLYAKYIKIRRTPLFPGQFELKQSMPTHFKVAEYEININFDRRIDVKVYSKGLGQEKFPDRNGMHRYRFTYKQEKAIPIEPDQIDGADYAPYVQATTFADYGTLGAAYQEKSKRQAKVTLVIQKLADELTAGVDDQREQVRILYSWVSKNIRYVGSYIGNGGYVPHDSQTIFDNRWGDCKDHVVILESLLAAKGIGSSPALINTGNTYVLPKLPALVFDHVITYVPSLDLYLDSTAQFAPMGMLPSSDLDKQVVLTGLNRLGKTPPMLATQNTAKSMTILKLMPDGMIWGSSKLVTSGDTEIALRNKQFSIQGMPQVEVVRSILEKSNLTGIGEIHSSDPNDLTKPFEVSTLFTLDPVSNFPGPAAMPIPAGIDFGVISGNMLPKPKDKLSLPENCESFAFSNHYEIEFPSNIKITHLPDNVSYSNDSTQYTATYTLTDNKLAIKRELVSAHPTMVCGEAENEMDKKFFPIFQRDMRAQVIYE